MRFLGYLLAYVATVVVSWALPLIGIGLIIFILQVLAFFQPIIAVVLMVLLGIFTVLYSLRRDALWQGVLWSILWGIGIFSVFLGWFQYYALLLETIVFFILFIPGVITQEWATILRWFVIGELILTAFLIWGKVNGVMLLFVMILVVLSILLGAGSFRPYEVRRIRRRLASLAIISAIFILLWQPIISPSINSNSGLIFFARNFISSSPVGRFYNLVSLYLERKEIGERAKTEALHQLEDQLTSSHCQRWERGIQQIPTLPLSREEWEDLGIPQESDP